MNKPLMYSGFHAVEALLRHRPEAVLELFVQDTRVDRDDPRLAAMIQAAKDFGIAVQRARREVLEKHAGPQHQGIVARARPRRPADESALLQWLDGKPASPLLLILENVTDPHNLGACLRSADAAGVQAVIVPRRNAAGLTPPPPPFYYEIGNLASLLDQLRDRGVWVVGTALEERSESLFTFQPPESLAIVMGAEGSGLKRLTRDKCDQLLEIPMAGEVQSLNVSVATGVMLFQVRAQRS